MSIFGLQHSLGMTLNSVKNFTRIILRQAQDDNHIILMLRKNLQQENIYSKKHLINRVSENFQFLYT